MVIGSKGPATRTAWLAGQPSTHLDLLLPRGIPPSAPLAHPAEPGIQPHPNSALVAMWRGSLPAGCGHLLAWELGNLSFPVVFTWVRGVPLPLHIAFSAWSLPSVSPHNDFFCYINLTHCSKPRRWDPGLLNCVKGKDPRSRFHRRLGLLQGGCPGGGVGRGLGVVVGSGGTWWWKDVGCCRACCESRPQSWSRQRVLARSMHQGLWGVLGTLKQSFCHHGESHLIPVGAAAGWWWHVSVPDALPGASQPCIPGRWEPEG